MESPLPFWFEAGSLGVLILILIFDIWYAFHRPHVPSNRESALWIGFYSALAIVFAGTIWALGDTEHASQFVAAWLTEYSLSVDNLFVFLLIMARLKVPRRNQQELLMVGIILALILRGVFIVVGVQLIEAFSWIFYLFGLFLIYTAWHQAFGGVEDAEESENKLIGWMRRRFNISEVYDGAKLRTVVNGERVFTPVIIVIVALGLTDVMFALDSIPAVFGVTQSAFIVFTANIFALMGLRQLYFLLGHLVERLVYLTYGIAAILAFIGVKLVLHAMHENEVPFINGGEPIPWAIEIPTAWSLGFIVLAMTVAVLASVVKMRRTPEAIDA